MLIAHLSFEGAPTSAAFGGAERTYRNSASTQHLAKIRIFCLQLDPYD